MFHSMFPITLAISAPLLYDTFRPSPHSTGMMLFFALSANGQQIKMTEDHRIANYSERLRIEGIGEPLKDRVNRLYGINLARMLGDKFLNHGSVQNLI